MKLYTIGFTQTSAENFFRRIKQFDIRVVVDVRLKPDSQLSGFAKRRDLAFFLREIALASYKHESVLAPTKELLDSYKKGLTSWDDYATRYIELIGARRADASLTPESLDGACLLCSEDKPHKCHRRLAAEYLSKCWGGKLEVVHL